MSGKKRKGKKKNDCKMWLQYITQKGHYITLRILEHLSSRRRHKIYIWLWVWQYLWLALPVWLWVTEGRFDVCETRTKMVHTHTQKGDFGCRSNLSLWRCLTANNHACISCVDSTNSVPLHSLAPAYTPLITTSLPVVALFPLLCSHISNSTFFLPSLPPSPL